MKKISLLTLLCSAIFVNCTNDSAFEIQRTDDSESEYIPQTEIFALGQSLEPRTKASDLPWRYASPEGWETARFSIRADRSIPDYTDKSSALYYGRPAGKAGKNRGKILTAYPYGHYNDRDLDYSKVDKKTGENIGYFRYVYDRKGLKTQFAILEAPHVREILEDEKDDLEAKITANPSDTKSINALADVNGLIAQGDDYLDSHVLWYVVKEVGVKYGWHVNGTIVDYVVGEPDNIPENVEVDIHQQEHFDWNEIKTSIHIRTDVESVKINIPLGLEDIIEQDDFDIRVYNSYFKEYKEVTHTITHDSNGITIEISNISAAMIEELKTLYGDGLTIEIFSHCIKEDDVETIWNKVKNSTVVSTGKACAVTGQITSAYHDGVSLPIRVMNP
jgi:hypothetical protein